MAPENRIAAVIARTTYHPAAEVPGSADVALPARRIGPLLRPRTLIEIFLGFYSARSARWALVISTFILAYGGGAVMFWFHAIYLGEGGPAISNWTHWALDSTAGFLALMPALAVILPLAAWLTAGRDGLRPVRFAVLGGAMFALITAPAPLMHDALLARGTWLADRVTDALGDGRTPAADTWHAPAIVDMVVQVGAGLATYIPLMLVALLAVRGMVRLAPVSVGPK